MAKAVYISSSCAAAMLSAINVCVQRLLVSLALPSVNKFDKPKALLPLELILTKFNSGISRSEVQLLNMEDAFVIAVVTSRGRVCNELQLLNIPLIVVTAAVLNKGTVCSAVQVLNMFAMFVTVVVTNNGTDCNEEQALNILPIFIAAAILNNGTVCNEVQD